MEQQYHYQRVGNPADMGSLLWTYGWWEAYEEREQDVSLADVRHRIESHSPLVMWVDLRDGKCPGILIAARLGEVYFVYEHEGLARWKHFDVPPQQSKSYASLEEALAYVERRLCNV